MTNHNRRTVTHPVNEHPEHQHHSDHPPGHLQHGGHTGHGKHAGHSPEIFKRRFFICLLLTLPILYFSTQLQDWLNYQAIAFPGSQWINPILGIIIYFYGGWVFLKGAWNELHSQIGMMTLIALATVTKQEGDEVVAASVNGEGSVKVKVKGMELGDFGLTISDFSTHAWVGLVPQIIQNPKSKIRRVKLIGLVVQSG